MQAILENEVVQYLIHKITTHFPQDVDLVVAYGSRVTGTAQATSDTDVFVVTATDAGYQSVENFILAGVGHDIFAVSWDRLDEIAQLQESLLPLLGGSVVVWARNQEVTNQFERLRTLLHKNLGDREFIAGVIAERVRDCEDLLPRVYESADVGVVRDGVLHVAMLLGEALAFHNGTYFSRGIRTFYEDLIALPLKPEASTRPAFWGQYEKTWPSFMELFDHLLRATDPRVIARVGHDLIYVTAKFLEVTSSNAVGMLETPVSCVHWPTTTTMMLLDEDQWWEAFGYTTHEDREVDENLDYRRAAWWYEESCQLFDRIYECERTRNVPLAILTAALLQASLRSDVPAPWPETDLLGAWNGWSIEKLANRARSIEKLCIEMIETNGITIRRLDSAQELYAGNPVRLW